ARDTLLLRPRLIAARDSAVYVYDYGDAAVKVFDKQAQLKWRFGQRGRGPGEFANPFDIEVGRDGRVWLLDVGAGRITSVSPSGALDRILVLHGKLAASFVVLNGELLVLTASLDPFSSRIAEDGRVLATAPSPLPLERIAPFARQTLTASTADGRTWAITFPYGNAVLVYDEMGLRCRGWLVEGGDFPQELGTDIPIWAAGVAVTDTSVVVLARGRGDDQLRLLDHYSLSDCSYQGTDRLPRRMSALAYADGVFYLEYEDPAPTVIGLRPRRR
ncbi:MAG: 6-bladed beta-propeller, partial [bacterium]